MRRLFLDANILLDFYRFGDDDISEIRKILALIAGQELYLFTNQHLTDEISRNREKVISESLAEIKSLNYRVKTPNYGKDLPEYKALTEILKKANSSLANFTASLQNLIANRALPADNLISDLMSASQKIPITPEIMSSAKDRMALSNPPGKKGSLGDALHWECLLSIELGYNSDIVSRDGDFASELDPKRMKDFLIQEWNGKFGKYSEISIFRSLSEYFSARFPQIKLSEELKKDELISQLQTSANFATTHALIADLSHFSFFTNAQVVKMFEALNQNTQVGWIGTDADLQEFYLRLKDKAYWVPDEIQAQCAAYLNVNKDDFFSLI
jgi:hypothetical protein